MERIPPQDLGIERSLLGSILVDPSILCQAIIELSPDDFSDILNGEIFEVIKDANEKGIPIDILSIANYLKTHPKFNKKENIEITLTELYDNVATTTSIDHYIKIIKLKSVARKMINYSEEIKKIARQSQDIESLVSSVEKGLFDIIIKDCREKARPIGEILKEVSRECAEARPNEISGIPCGFKEIDFLTCGFQPGDLIILGGRTSHGKTSFALSCMLNMAKQGFPCYYSNFESRDKNLGRRILSMEGKTNLVKMKNGYLKSEERDFVVKVSDNMQKLPVIIEDNFDVNIYELYAKSRLFKIKYNIQVVFVDYLQLISRECYKSNMSTNDRVGLVTRGLKKIAKELDVPVIALSQVSRPSKLAIKSKSHRPNLEDLRDSGEIEQHADLVMFVHREWLFKKEEDDLKNKAEIIIAKQRDGPVGIVDVKFQAECVRYHDEVDGW